MPPKPLTGLKKSYHNWPHWASLDSFVQGVSSLHPLSIVLFGSLAKSDFTQYSDADVLVVFDRPVEWLSVYGYSDGTTQPVVKTLKEMETGIEQGNTFLVEAIEDGVPLLDQDETYAKLRELCQEAKARLGLVRETGGWRGRVQ